MMMVVVLVAAAEAAVVMMMLDWANWFKTKHMKYIRIELQCQIVWEIDVDELNQLTLHARYGLPAFAWVFIMKCW